MSASTATGRGYTGPGMINTMYIDLHYTSGRRSGVAFHGTTRYRYRRLGTNVSHGCIRMRQENALAVLNRVTGRDKVLAKDMRWGEVPRFWKTERGRKRLGYTRDGTPHPVEAPPPEEDETAEAGEAVQVANLLPQALSDQLPAKTSEAEPYPNVLTKTGFRAIAVIFKD